MTSFSFNYDRSWVQFPYGMLLNTHRNPSKSREITADMDDKTISEIFVDSLMEIVKKNFDTGTALKVNVRRGTTAGYDIKFDPLPPPGRLYFLTKTAQVIRPGRTDDRRQRKHRGAGFDHRPERDRPKQGTRRREIVGM